MVIKKKRIWHSKIGDFILRFLKGVLKIKRLSFSNWLIILGSIIFFISWIVEKTKQTEWSEQKDNLKRSQLVIDITEIERSLYEIHLISEVKKDALDTFQVSYLQQRLCRIYLDLLSWGKGRVTENGDQYSKMINSKHKIDSANLTALQNGNYALINGTFNVVSDLFKESYMELDKEYSNKVDEVNETSEYWNKMFMRLYILGSILVGASFILEKTTKNKEL